MANKRLLYLLIPAVVIIWGLIAMQITKRLKKNDPYIALENFHSQKSSRMDSVTFKLEANYRDPFLGMVNNADNNVKKIVSKKDTKNKPVDFIVLQQINETFSQVSFGGLIEGGRPYSLGLFNIKGKRYLLQKGQQVDDVIIAAMYKDSSRLYFKGAYKTILKKK